MAQIEHLTTDQREEWDSLVLQEPHFGLLQSWKWGEIKEKLGWKAFRIGVRQNDHIVAGAQVLLKSVLPGLASIAYVPRGPIGNWLEPSIASTLFMKMHQVARRHGAIFLRIEPPLVNNAGIDQLLRQHGFSASPHANQPRSTIILDLRPDLDTLFGQIRKGTRRKIKDAARKGVTVRIGGQEDLPAFYQLMQATSKRAGFSIRPYHHYLHEWQTLADLGQSVMLMAFYQDNLLAVNIIYCCGVHAAFFHQASSDEYGNLNPNSLLVWEGIKWLKERGVLTYDLWGIADEIGQIVSQGGELPGHERTDGLWGVYQFKSGFCKNIVYYTGAYDFGYRPFLCRIASSDFLSDNLERISIRMEWIGRSRCSV